MEYKSQGTKMNLRLQTEEDVDQNRDLLELSIVLEGTPDKCAEYASERNFHWQDKPNMLFGGYWASEIGDCLLPT